MAQSIVAQSGSDLAVMVTAVAQSLDFGDRAFPLAFTGGAILANAGLRHALETGLAQRGIQPTPLVAVRDPVAGAVHLALRLAAESRQR